jgi:trk system potassium uptake protein TrkA
MNIVIMGCGRVGARLAGLLDIERHSVTILDVETYSFRRLPAEFAGTALAGDGMDEEVLKKAGIEKADVFVAVTESDNHNVMAAQIAKHIFNVPKVLCRIYDPLSRELFSSLGIEALSPTTTFAQMLKDKIEQ